MYSRVLVPCAVACCVAVSDAGVTGQANTWIGIGGSYEPIDSPDHRPFLTWSGARVTPSINGTVYDGELGFDMATAGASNIADAGSAWGGSVIGAPSPIVNGTDGLPAMYTGAAYGRAEVNSGYDASAEAWGGGWLNFGFYATTTGTFEFEVRRSGFLDAVGVGGTPGFLVWGIAMWGIGGEQMLEPRDDWEEVNLLALSTPNPTDDEMNALLSSTVSSTFGGVTVDETEIWSIDLVAGQSYNYYLFAWVDPGVPTPSVPAFLLIAGLYASRRHR